MALSIAVHPLTPTLDMYGESDSRAAYSLSGHVCISVSSSSQTTARLLLQSLSLTFEGQSEILIACTGYSSLRLCSITRELTPKPTELSNEGSGETCLWNVIFNLPIPGWLPPTTTQGKEDVGICYSLYATAKFTNLNEDPTLQSFAPFSTPFRSQAKSAHAQMEVQLRRFISAPRVNTPIPKVINYLVDSHDLIPVSVSSKPRVPVQVLNKIQVLASVPEYIDVEGRSLPLTLRLRTKDLCEQDCKRLQVTEVIIDVLQREKWRFRPSSRCLRQYPLPPREMQPPNVPLLDPHPLSFIYESGAFGSTAESACRTFSLLPSSSSGTYKLSENNYVFSNDATPQEVPTWYTMEALVPFVQCSPVKADVDCPELGAPNLLPSLSSPLYSVYHSALITLTCAFDLPSGDVGYEQLKFAVPIIFAKVAPNLPLTVKTWTLPSVRSPSSADAAVLFTSTTSPSSLPHPPEFSSNLSPDPIPVLPAYSQLYDFNGERRIDYSTPLPLYSPRLSAETLVNVSSSTSISPPYDSQSLGFTDTYHDDHDYYNVKVNTPLPLLMRSSDAVEVTM